MEYLECEAKWYDADLHYTFHEIRTTWRQNETWFCIALKTPYNLPDKEFFTVTAGAVVVMSTHFSFTLSLSTERSNKWGFLSTLSKKKRIHAKIKRIIITLLATGNLSAGCIS